MRKTEKDRLVAELEAVLAGPDRTSVYDAIASAERDEQDAGTRRLLHEAAVALLHSQHDAAHLEQVRALLASILPSD